MIRTSVTPIPQEVRDIAYSEDEIWHWVQKCGGWAIWHATDFEGEKFIHRNCIAMDYPEHLPEFLKKMEQFVNEPDTIISVFVSDNSDTQSALGWHVDPYEVFAFNIEGETVWEYFDIPEGKLKSIQLGAMDKIIHMPCGVSHRVRILSEGRTSISIVRPSKVLTG
jgi:hypothetical protein